MSALRKSAVTPTEQDPRWAAVVAKDPSADGRFYYGVKTTGVYCRPSCAARLANPRNVSFYATPRDAEAAGFRACKRCKPMGPSRTAEHSATIAWACRMIEGGEEAPSTAQLAKIVGLSTFHFHRLFKSMTGLTPKAYAQAHRAREVRARLPRSASVTAAAYDAGFNASSRFYEKSVEILGMKPGDYRRGGPGERIRFALAQCSLGAILVAASEKGICAISLGDDPEALLRELEDRFPKAQLIGGDAAFEHTVAKVIAFVEKPGVGLDLPLDVRGTAFQERVWRALRKIPVGRSVTYAELAAKIGTPAAVRAVAGACAANTIAVAIPCHRVVRKGGALSGYRWGVTRKRALLDRESAKKKA
ncbi:MAG: bifunctional DNA-binding transcriptional regulator/O6-methylguanine-DNA methyltransferase Ada [Proteobacteria bacterium]|nr:bifunctional DNA-binding transcriptional regulator/O6-methylguanine-DNA methyltransferase Ada [Pseudomonadota bacterium]